MRRAGVRPVLVAAASLAAVVACAGPAGALQERAERTHVRATLAAAGLSLDSAEGLLESSAGLDGEPGAGAGAGARGKKNPLVAMIMSAAVPGWGELYTGNTGRARGFISAEAAIWIGYAAFTVQENLRTEDYEEYAAIFARIPEGSSSDYYQDVADYIRSEGDDSYNEAIRAEARSLYPDDLEAQRAYVEANGHFGSSSWEWDSRVRFDKYRGLRHDAALSRKNAFYMTGLAVLNRALSVIDSAWMARRYNKGHAGDPTARLSLSPEFSEGTVGSRLALEVSF